MSLLGSLVEQLGAPYDSVLGLLQVLYMALYYQRNAHSILVRVYLSAAGSHCVSFCPPLAHHPIFPPAIMSAEEVANAFVPHYYQLLDSNPDNLVQLFVSTQCTSTVY
jgi:hypothetical protein